jgi:hypothetical protein
MSMAEHGRIIDGLKARVAELGLDHAAAIRAVDEALTASDGTAEAAQRLRTCETQAADLAGELERTRATLRRRCELRDEAEAAEAGEAKVQREQAAQAAMLEAARALKPLAKRAAKLAQQVCELQADADALMSTMHAKALATGLTAEDAMRLRERVLDLSLVWVGAWGIVRRNTIEKRQRWPVLFSTSPAAPWVSDGYPAAPETYADLLIAKIEQAFPEPIGDPFS